MKKIIFGVIACALLAIVACERKDDVRTVSFRATLSDQEAPSKAVVALNGSSKPQTFWENGDQITVYTQADGDTPNSAGYTFSTTLGANATSATFSYTGDGCEEGNYLAIYPAATAKRTVNFTGADDIYKMAAVDIPTTQTLVAGSVDRKAMVQTAYATSGSTTLAFKNAVALVKFQVSGANIKGGSIIVDGADGISGRFRADLSTTAPYEPIMTKYNAGGVAQHNFVNFTIDGSTNLSAGTDYYVAVCPTTLTDGFKVYLNGSLVKTIPSASITAFQRSRIYDLGTLSIPGSPSEKGLAFDFTLTPKSGWPTTAGYAHTEGGIECLYPQNGTDWSFILADCGTAAKAQTIWAISSPIKRLSFAAEKRYLGVPAISGYKLVKITCTNARSSAPAQIGIVKGITVDTSHPAASEYLAGGEKKKWTKNGNETETYTLSGTAADTRYYIYAYAKGDFTGLTLTYEKEE